MPHARADSTRRAHRARAARSPHFARAARVPASVPPASPPPRRGSRRGLDRAGRFWRASDPPSSWQRCDTATCRSSRATRGVRGELTPRLLPNAHLGFIAGVELEEVVATLAPRLVAYVLGRTSCRGTAEDIAQEALTALVRRWKQTGPPESPDGYAFAIARR